ncbi:MAG: hypothetical protein K5905_02880 [Roseibium sp.]|uniref:BadF/BadG/BcrA/BcrD ATPase family protein n=1 Tax=Roseibium sp. TaxID=1936156 RepID=UPI00260CE562|nr:BadF/BadG/BcrA/BcrD ATPase family protein [Roseibium sp.]MCV0424392.1 hypothetical protein [Roseibium sp.]
MNDQLQTIAIDGGGTRCRVAGGFGERRHVIEVGSANVSTDLDGSISEILRGLEKLASDLGISLSELERVPAYIGLAGASWPDIATKVAGKLPFDHVRVEDDRRSAARGAFGHDDGILVHCGTGSFQLMQRAGRITLAGGWGPVLGDEASAQWVGRKALTAVLRVCDGLKPASPLIEQLHEKFGPPGDIVAYAGTASPADFGAIARYVTAAAGRKDRIAIEILQDGADHIMTELRSLGWSQGLPLMLTGGIAGHYAGYLEFPMQSALAQPKGQPIDGALSLAQEFAEELSLCSV